MEKIKRYSIVNLVGVLLIIAAKIIQTSIFDSDSDIDRRASFYIGILITIPAFVASLISFFLLLRIYLTNKKELSLSKFYLVIPFLLMLLFIVVLLIIILIESIK
ncbi:hypothetical protein [Flagellimonas pacifica]|uniref:Uncharacterized protein n=1 Tax=Flagellimonas pacifica TaxID=1247520 RepID=A0A285MB81_9FLAO|nr:hypothetical protein [Allomuricauda parva]SNY94434.1 hypothetical protein SAMN06265377_0092 [Allomuricauda parva]